MIGSASCDASVVRYRPMPGGQLLPRVIFAMFAVISVFLVGSAFSGSAGAPPASFVVFWLLGLGWNAYRWLFRIAAELEAGGERFEVLAQRRDADVVGVLGLEIAPRVTSSRPASSAWPIASPWRSS
jgi:hypothetical protein